MNESSLKKFNYFFIAIAGLFLIHTIYLECVAEDAYITFRFAKNLAKGNGFVWNVSEPPVEGFTNFLWVVICAGLAKLSLPIPFFSQILGVIASLGTMWITYQFALNIFRLNRWHALLPVLLLACSGPFATWATSGMETNIFGLFTITGCYLYAKYWVKGNVKNLWLGFFVLFMATLTRPEGFFVFGLLIGLTILVTPGQYRKVIREFVPSTLFYIIPFIIYFTWRYNYFGYPLPNTFYAKTGGGVDQNIRGALHTAFFYAYFVIPLFIPPIVLSVFKKFRFKHLLSDAVPTITNLNDLTKHINNNIGLYQCLLVTFFYTIYIIYVGGDYMAMFRFYVPILPFIYLIISSLLVFIYRYYKNEHSDKVFTITTVVSIMAILIQSTPLEKSIFPRIPNNHGTYRGVKYECWHAARLTIIGQYFNRVKNNYQDSLATGGIGATSYNADMRIIGLHGLVDTYLAHKTFAPGILGKGLPGHERGDLPYIFSKKPTYFMFSRKFTKEPSEIPDKILREVGEDVKNNYIIKSVWLKDTVNNESGYFTYLKRR